MKQNTFDEANIEGTLEDSPNKFNRRGVHGGAFDEDDENIDEEDERIAQEGQDENRMNIHGNTDSVILKNLGVGQEDLRESQVHPVNRVPLEHKKSLIQGRP